MFMFVQNNILQNRKTINELLEISLRLSTDQKSLTKTRDCNIYNRASLEPI